MSFMRSKAGRMILFFLGVSLVWLEQTVLSASLNRDGKGIAVHGYDPVAYFKSGGPVKGKQESQLDWMGAKWFFANTENRDLFAANPTKYAPQYGGFCAYAVSENTTADIDPNAWDIVEGKLYLNKNLTVRDWWRKDISGRINKADKNWPELMKR